MFERSPYAEETSVCAYEIFFSPHYCKVTTSHLIKLIFGNWKMILYWIYYNFVKKKREKSYLGNWRDSASCLFYCKIFLRSEWINRDSFLFKNTFSKLQWYEKFLSSPNLQWIRRLKLLFYDPRKLDLFSYWIWTLGLKKSLFIVFTWYSKFNKLTLLKKSYDKFWDIIVKRWLRSLNSEI